MIPFILSMKRFIGIRARLFPDVNARDMRGRTPLDATEGAIAELLRKHSGKTGEESGSNGK